MLSTLGPRHKYTIPFLLLWHDKAYLFWKCHKTLTNSLASPRLWASWCIYHWLCDAWPSWRVHITPKGVVVSLTCPEFYVINLLCLYMFVMHQLSEMSSSLCQDEGSPVEETSTADIVSYVDRQHYFLQFIILGLPLRALIVWWPLAVQQFLLWECQCCNGVATVQWLRCWTSTQQSWVQVRCPCDLLVATGSASSQNWSCAPE